MAEAVRRGRKWLRILGISLAVLLVLLGAGGLLAFKMFEPAFVYRSGWEPMPEADYPAISETAPGWAALGGAADAWLTEARAALDAPALSAAVSIGGEIVWAGAAGYADLDRRAPVTLETAFRVGSSSKPVTAIGMGVLLEAGAVDLDAPVSVFAPDLRAPLANVTLRQAMNHSAGVREYGSCLCFPVMEYYSRAHYPTQRASLRPFEKDALLFAPGEAFAYSSYGYNLAGVAIESASGRRFQDFMQDSVFAPLGMETAHLDDRGVRGAPHPGDASFYEVIAFEGAVYEKDVFPTDNTNRLPSGGVIASPSDMARLGHQFIAPTLFSEQTRDRLIESQSLANGDPMPQGYRLGVRGRGEAPAPDGGTTLLLNHHGVAYGATSYFAIWPEYGLVVSAMMNRGNGAPLIPEAAPALEALAMQAILARRTGAAETAP